MSVTYETEEEVLAKAQEAIGIPVGQFDVMGRLCVQSNKGGIGQVLEEGLFGYKPNSEAEPDFKEAKVELKVTPYKRNRDGSISAKERLVLNIIDYMKEHACSFEESSFWHKNATILMMLYEHIENLPKTEFKITNTFLYKYPKDDFPIIKRDWETITNKIRFGLAHELSEGDTMYLGACTKGSTAAQSLRDQPFSEEKAKQRAYCLKTSYMTGLLRRFIFGNNEDERIIKNVDELKHSSFEEIITNRLKPYFGKRKSELLNEFQINAKAKAANERIIAALLGVQGNLAQTSEFSMANILPKTVQLEINGSIKESMSFKSFKANELVQESWEESALKELFETSKFMFILFRKTAEGDSVFEGIKFWNMPQRDLLEVEKVWRETVRVLNEGVQFCSNNGKVQNNLPKTSFSRVAHVRPHARNSDDVDILPDGRTMTKHSFWLNSQYIREILFYAKQ